MCKPPIKTPHFYDVERLVINCALIKEKIIKYREVMIKIYFDIVNIIYQNKELINSSCPKEAVTLKDRIEQSDSIKSIIRDYSKNNGVNITLVRFAVNHVVEILKQYRNKTKKCFNIDDFLNYVKATCLKEVDIVLSIKNVDGKNVYRVNLGRFSSNDKIAKNCYWFWIELKLNKDIDEESVKAMNTHKGQDMDRPSQHKESSRLVLSDDGTIKIVIKMKKEEPIAYPHGGIMAIDVGLNRFLTILSYSLSDNKGKSIIVEDQDLLNRYKDAVKRGNTWEIESAIVAIQNKTIEELNRVIIEIKPKYIIIENIREGLEKTESTWTNSFPWINHQSLLANAIAAKGVYVIWINPHGTSGCHAYSDDTIVRDNSNHSFGHCLLGGEKVDCDKNAVLNILSRGLVKVLLKFVLEDKVSEIKEYADQKGFMINELNYAAARDIVDFCKERYGLNLSVI